MTAPPGGDDDKPERRAAPARDRRRPLVHRTDLAVALVILAVCAALAYTTSRFETVSPLFAQDVPPEFFPRLVIGTIVALTLLLPFEHLFEAGRGKDIDASRSARIDAGVFATVALLGVVVASIAWIGTFLSMVLVCLALPILWGEVRFMAVALFAVVFPSLVTVVFAYLLGVHFEPGYLVKFLT